MTSTAAGNAPADEFCFKLETTAEALEEKFLNTRDQTEKLCEPLETEDYVVQSMPDVSPTKWHLAHTTWFFETFVLSRFHQAYRPFHADFSFLFNSYYVQAGERHLRHKRGLITRPTVKQVFEYREFVNRNMVALLQELDDSELQQAAQLVEIGCNHEQQHQELLLTDLKNVFFQNPLYPVYRKGRKRKSESPKVLGWVSFEEGLYEIGCSGEAFCFDNEKPRHRVWLEKFRLSDRLITNGEYLEFMEDGGYRNPLLWLSEGWQMVEERGWEAPLYWQKREGEWVHFTLNGRLSVPPSEPVCHVSHYEADAFARWAGARLPLESEWEVAATSLPVKGNLLESESFHPRCLEQHGEGVKQLFGDVWEWTGSPYVGYPGYWPAPGALGEYNGKFMSNQMVLRGGSCATAQSHIRAPYRNFFPSPARWQFSGIRLAKGEHGS